MYSCFLLHTCISDFETLIISLEFPFCNMKYYPQDSFRPEPLVEGGGQTVAILCSSGTNGLPKPICLSNKSLLLSFGISSELVLYTSSSMDWLTGLLSFIASVMFGATLIKSRPGEFCSTG